MGEPGKKYAGPDASAIAKLTGRQLDVFALIGEGKTTAEIAKQLGLEHSTVETYRDRIKKKLNLANGNQLIRDAAIWRYQHRDD
jgi:DNA-binding NarL/FixJ family response regulator